MVSPDSIPRYAQPSDPSPADRRTCGGCALCKEAPGGALCCARPVLEADDPDDAGLPEVGADWDACDGWRESKWR